MAGRAAASVLLPHRRRGASEGQPSKQETQLGTGKVWSGLKQGEEEARRGGSNVRIADMEAQSIQEGVPLQPEPEPSPKPVPSAGSRKKAVNRLILEGVMRAYRERLRPLESKSLFHLLNPLLTDAEFSATPSVLLVGQYSVGKTTFIRNLVGKDFGQRIGPEPTTDRFTAVFHGEDDNIVPGNSLAMQADKPYRSLSKFGVGFLDKFEGSSAQSEILEQLTFVDTPGILAGEKQRSGRGYDFRQIAAHFAARSDMILLLFDANKLDISDEMREVIVALRPHFGKLKVVLNKADACDQQTLMRVHGALMWSLSPVVQTPEVLRVYTGSFRDDAYDQRGHESYALFDKERADLMNDLNVLPRNNVSNQRGYSG
jgi:GTPase SAR1 family protein